MGKNYGLTNTEMELMEFLWKKDLPVSFKDIAEYFNKELNKGWKKQTLNTYLVNLQKIGVIEADKSSRYYSYYPLCTKEKLIQNWTKKMVRDVYGNSIGNLVAAFTGGKKLSPEEAEKIQKLI